MDSVNIIKKCIMTLNITTFSVMTLGIKDDTHHKWYSALMTLSINDTAIMLIVVMLSVKFLIVMLNVFMP